MKSSSVGFLVSAILHVGLLMLVVNMSESRIEIPKKAEPIPMTLAMFEPAPNKASHKPEVENLLKPKTPPLSEVKPQPKTKTKTKKTKTKKTKVAKKKHIKKKLKAKPKPKPRPKAKPKPSPKPKRIAKPKPKPKPKPKQKYVPPSHPVVKAKPQPKPPVQRTSQATTNRSAAATSPSTQQAKPVMRSSKAVANNARSAQVEVTYKARLKQLINSHKRYPSRAKRRGKQGKVTVRFTILKNGTIQRVVIAASSGNSSLDKAALKAVKSVSGQLPFPKGIQRSQWVLTVPIVYQLR